MGKNGLVAGKWLELLAEIAPNVSRVAVLRDATRGPGIGQFAVIQAMAPPHRVELHPINVGDPAEMERRSQHLRALRMPDWS